MEAAGVPSDVVLVITGIRDNAAVMGEAERTAIPDRRDRPEIPVLKITFRPAVAAEAVEAVVAVVAVITALRTTGTITSLGTAEKHGKKLATPFTPDVGRSV